LLAIAKTRRGKSSLMLRLVHHLMLAGTAEPGGREAGADKRCLILVDPHSDLATAALALVPHERRDDVVYLDIANRKRPFGINLLDVGLGWDRDQAVGNALRVFKREFDAFWGPRMEDAFRFALMALFEANEAICHMDPNAGRSSQHTVLEVPDLLGIPRFRHSVLKRTADPAIWHWFSSYFDPLELRHRQEIINPVQTKVHKYAGSKVARAIVGQPRSTIDFRDLIARDAIVIINLRAFEVIEDTAALVGGTLLNLAARAVSSQSSLPPEQRRSVGRGVRGGGARGRTQPPGRARAGSLPVLRAADGRSHGGEVAGLQCAAGQTACRRLGCRCAAGTRVGTALWTRGAGCRARPSSSG